MGGPTTFSCGDGTPAHRSDSQRRENRECDKSTENPPSQPGHPHPFHHVPAEVRSNRLPDEASHRENRHRPTAVLRRAASRQRGPLGMKSCDAQAANHQKLPENDWRLRQPDAPQTNHCRQGSRPQEPAGIEPVSPHPKEELADGGRDLPQKEQRRSLPGGHVEMTIHAAARADSATPPPGPPGNASPPRRTAVTRVARRASSLASIFRRCWLDHGTNHAGANARDREFPTPRIAPGGERGKNFRKSGRRGLNVPTATCTLMYMYRTGPRAEKSKPSPSLSQRERRSRRHTLEGGRVPLVLNPEEPNSTRTPSLHREGRDESGGV